GGNRGVDRIERRAPPLTERLPVFVAGWQLSVYVALCTIRQHFKQLVGLFAAELFVRHSRFNRVRLDVDDRLLDGLGVDWHAFLVQPGDRVVKRAVGVRRDQDGVQQADLLCRLQRGSGGAKVIDEFPDNARAYEGDRHWHEDDRLRK